MSLHDEVEEFRRFLDGIEIQGYPKRETELVQLRALIERYPEEARQIITGETWQHGCSKIENSGASDGLPRLAPVCHCRHRTSGGGTGC